jgi:hypothetical protein
MLAITRTRKHTPKFPQMALPSSKGGVAAALYAPGDSAALGASCLDKTA